MAFPKPSKRLGEKAKSPKPGVPLNKKQLLEMIPRYRGNISRIADALGCVRHTVRRAIDADQDLGKALEDARERRIDELEEQTHMDALERQDATMRIFLLKTLGRHRGYDQDESHNTAQNIAKAAFDFVLNRSKSPVDSPGNGGNPLVKP